jgi:GTP-binding protein
MGDDAHSNDGPDLEAGRLLFAQQCRFHAGVADETQIPHLGLPEVAFAGRSNVGKSSLINALTGYRTLARISNTPGRTQQINFFDLGARLALVDLPGYGFARASKSSIRQWTGLVQRYLRGRRELVRVCLLIDARHGIKDSDREVMQILDVAAVSYQVVLTKIDKVAAGARAGVVAAVSEEASRRPAAYPQVACTSALKKEGIAELRAGLAALAAAVPNG